MEVSTDSSVQDFTENFTNVYLPGEEPQQLYGDKLRSIYIGIGVIGLVGNAFVVVVMLSSPAMREKTTNWYIIHQSIIDGLVSIALIGTARITPLHDYYGVLGFMNCLIWQSKIILWILLLCSTYNLVVLTVERYLEIIFPIYHKLHFSKAKAIISLVGVWVFSIAFDLAGKAPTTYIADGRCHFLSRWPSTAARRAYGIWVVIVKFFFPLLVLVYCYGQIAIMLHKRIKTGPKNTAGAANETVNTSHAPTRAKDAKESRLQRGKRNTIKTLALVAAAFVICWSCNQFYFLLMNIGYNLSLKSNFYHFSVIMDFVNSCINPFIYVFQFEQFQAAARRLFFMIFMRHRLNQVGPGEMSNATSA